MTKDLDRADEIYVAKMLIEEGEPETDAIGIAEIARFLTEPGYTLLPGQTRRLFADRQLRQAYAAFKAKLQTYEVPTLLAASDGAVDERAFPGGRMRLIPARRGNQVYLRIEFSARRPAPPGLLEVVRPNGDWVKLPLGASNEAGELVVPLDLDDPHHAAIVEALRDPLSSGGILPLQTQGEDE